MTTATKTVELARMNQDGSWDLIGDYAGLREALADVPNHCSGAYHLDDDSVVFGVSEDPDSGHYETRVGAWAPDYEAVVLS